MKNIPKDKRTKLVLVAMGTFVVLAGFWYGALFPQRSKLKQIAAKTAEAETRLADGLRTAASAEATAADLRSVSERLVAIEAGMPSGDMYAWFIQTMDRFRLPYRVDLPQKSREVVGETGLFAKFPYRAATFSVRGGGFFHDFGKFLADFENAFPYMRVQNLELESSSLNSTNLDEREKLAFKMEIVAPVNSTLQ